MKPRLSYPPGLPEPDQYEYDQIAGGIRQGLASEKGVLPDLEVDHLHSLAREEFDRHLRGEPFQYLTRHGQKIRAAEYFDKIANGDSSYRALAAVLGLPFGVSGRMESPRLLEVQADEMPPELHAARDLHGPSRGQHLHQQAEEAGEEPQDPGGDWEGA